MTFAAPLFLIAALAATIPIVLHLFNRRRAKEASFPTLRFLKLSVEKTRRRKRLQDLLLMILRAAVLLLLAIALARPAVVGFGSLWGGKQTAVAMILDNSASMGTIDADRIRLDTAIDAAAQILDQLDTGDRVALLPTCGPEASEPVKLDGNQQPIHEYLQQCRVSYQRANLDLKLRQARKLLADDDSPNKQIYILSDMQRASWVVVQSPSAGNAGNNDHPTQPGAAVPHPSPLSSLLSPLIILVDCNRVPKPDAAVERIEIDSPLRMAGMPAKAVVTVANAAEVEQQRLIELIVDGVKRATSPQLNLPPGGRAKHDFPLQFKRPGLHRGEVRLVGEDGSMYDNRRFFVYNIGRNVPVAVVAGRRHEIAYLDDAFYLERALTAANGFDVASFSSNDLADEPLDGYKVVFCVNLPALDVASARRLADYVAGGGNVVWLAGENVEPEAYNRMNHLADDRLLPAPLTEVRRVDPSEGRDSLRVAFLDDKYSPLRNLVDPTSLYDSVLVYRHVGMAVEKGHARVLARLDDGRPLLVERGVGDGHVLMLGVAAKTDWSNLPLRKIFMPLVVQLTYHLSATGDAGSELIAGQPLDLNVAQPPSAGGISNKRPSQPGAAGLHEVELIPPDGEMLRMDVADRFHYANTYDIGIYELRIPDASAAAWAINYDSAEADPMKIEPAELEPLLGGAEIVTADDPNDLTATFVRLREGSSLWEPFLLAVLIGLVFETLISNRFGAMRNKPGYAGGGGGRDGSVSP